MLLCVTTSCFIGFNSCQKDTLPLTNLDNIENESQDPLLREDGIFGDIEFPEHECDCCVRILDWSVITNPPNASFVINIEAAGGTIGEDNCEGGGNSTCPHFQAVFGSQACVEAVFGEDDDNCQQPLDLTLPDPTMEDDCMTFNCLPSMTQFFAYVNGVDENCNYLPLQGLEFSFTIEIECNPVPLGPDCIGIDEGGQNPNPDPLVNKKVITLSNVNNYEAVEGDPFTFGNPNQCCQFETGFSED